MTTERVELPNGDWVDLVTRVNHAQFRRVQAGRTTEERTDLGVAAMICNWALRDVDGEPIPFPELKVDGIPIEALEAIPISSFVAIAEKAGELFSEELVPKASSETSPSSPPQESARQSRRTSQTSTSSPIIPDGPGMIYVPPRPT